MSKHYKVTEEFRQFCKSLFDHRFKAGGTQSSVADTIGVDQATVSRIERGNFGDVISETVYEQVSAYANAYSLKTPVLDEGVKMGRTLTPRTVRAARQVRHMTAASSKTADPKADATSAVLQLVASGAIPPDVAGIVIKALAS